MKMKPFLATWLCAIQLIVAVVPPLAAAADPTPAPAPVPAPTISPTPAQLMMLREAARTGVL
ncbi:MAG: hypothetical protein ACXW4I_12705, partial [Candidatus Deferrimicrobiaceae bacterium]